MIQNNDYIFVLWASEFEETTATIFVTELRQAGLPVKIVGLTRRISKGAHGLALVPDITLEQAIPLASQPFMVREVSDPNSRELCHRWATMLLFSVVCGLEVQSFCHKVDQACT